MAAKLLEITGTYQHERLRFANTDGDVVICDVRVDDSQLPDNLKLPVSLIDEDPFAVDDILGDSLSVATVHAASKTISFKGPADLDELREDQTYRFYGKWSTYRNKRTGDEEIQFHFQSFVCEAPHGREGIISYLRQAGEGYGFGKQRAAKCWEIFGSDAVKMFREQPKLVADQLTAAGLPLSWDKASIIAEVLAEEAALEGCTLDLMDLLTGRGFPKATARLAVRAWGNRAAQIIRRNPYKLMEFRGCGFKKTDHLYLDLKHDPHAIRRQGYCLWYTMARDTEGHTWYPQQFCERGLKGTIAADEVKFEHAVKFARRLGAVSESRTAGACGPIARDGHVRWFAEAVKAKREAEIAQVVADAASEPHMWPDVETITGISDHQREQLRMALTGQICILGGSPGTGKTFTLARLVEHLCRAIGPDNILIGAPTGKAAVRVSENLASYGLPLRARTWHSSLSILERLKTKHFPYKVLIGDESSMVDTDLMAAIMRARSVGTHFLLVGDINQLPPVGHGAPLRDLIAAKLPYGELREIKRQDGSKPNMIIEACAAIRDGRPYRVLRSLGDVDTQAGENLVRLRATTTQQHIDRILEVLRWARSHGYNPIWDCQVVVPVKAKSGLSCKELNKILQEKLNPNPGSPGSAFRVGDKIVNTKNGYFPAITFDPSDPDVEASDKGEVYVANGEQAEVLEVEPGCFIARLSSPDRTIRIPRGKAEEKETEPEEGDKDESTGTGCTWMLAYVITVHRSQGSEWPIAIPVLDDYPGARMVCSREWIFTSDSRGKVLTAEIGRDEIAVAMTRRIALNKRKTLLREQVLLAKAKNILADL